MGHIFIRVARTAPAWLPLLLSGCSGISVWPFDGTKAQNQSPTLANATEYQCDGGKHFHVRYTDNGNTAWLIYPDREVSLAKGAAASGMRYSNGIAALDVNGAEATLKDGPAITYTGCKAAGK